VEKIFKYSRKGKLK